MRTELARFIERAIESGISREEIKRTLNQAGWDSSETDRALRLFAESSCKLAVPAPVSRTSAFFAFVYLNFFVLLYLTIWHVVALVFEVIDRHSDRAKALGEVSFQMAIRWDVAALVVLLPLFTFVFLKVGALEAKDPGMRESRPRKWLAYLTMFQAVAVITASTSTLVYNFLGASETTPLVEKIAVLIGVAGGVLAYFYADVRRGEER